MRVSIKQLEAQVSYLNEITGNPSTYSNPKTKGANIGHYCLSGAYGGWSLQQITNKGGGVRCPLGDGYIPKRELSDQLDSYINGINLGIKERGKVNAK